MPTSPEGQQLGYKLSKLEALMEAIQRDMARINGSVRDAFAALNEHTKDDARQFEKLRTEAIASTTAMRGELEKIKIRLGKYGVIIGIITTLIQVAVAGIVLSR